MSGDFKVIDINDAGTSSKFGGDDLDKINRILNGEDLSMTILIDNEWSFKHNKLVIRDFGGDNKIRIGTSEEAADWSITIPVLGGNRTPLFTDLAQTIENKTLDFDSASGTKNIATNIPRTALVADIIDNSKLADNAVQTENISDSSITSSKIADNTIMNIDINDSAEITDGKLAQITDKAKLPTDTMYENTVQNDAFYKVYGEFIPRNKYGRTVGTGPFEHMEVISSGTLTPVADYLGDLMYYFTKSTAGSQSGLLVLAREFTQRAKNFSLKVAFACRDGAVADKREFIGLSTRTTILPQSDTPISTTESGFMFGRRTTDNNSTYKIFTNNGAGGAAQVVDTLVTIPTSIGIYFLEITGGPTNMTWQIQDSQTQNTLGSGTISSQLPGNTTPLFFQAVAENTSGGAKTIGIKKMTYRGGA